MGADLYCIERISTGALLEKRYYSHGSMPNGLCFDQ